MVLPFINHKYSPHNPLAVIGVKLLLKVLWNLLLFAGLFHSIEVYRLQVKRHDR